MDGSGLTVTSNNPNVVPNDDEVFKGKTGDQQRRTVEFYGLAPGTTMIEARDDAGMLQAELQVNVKPTPGGGPSWIKLDPPQTVLRAPDTPVPYRGMTTEYMVPTGMGTAELVSKIPRETKHLVTTSHGWPGIVGIGENLTIDNVKEFSALKGSELKVIWICGCAICGGPPEKGNSFCRALADYTGCYVVGAGMTLGFVNPPPGHIEWFHNSLPHYFSPDKQDERFGENDFLKRHVSLGFKVISTDIRVRLIRRHRPK